MRPFEAKGTMSNLNPNSDPRHEFSRWEAQATRWSIVQVAHGKEIGDAAQARQYLVLRYAPAIRSFVFGFIRDEHQADDVAQDVMVRLLQGDFAGADPSKGRFRDLLKTAVKNMVRNLWDKQKVRRAVDIDDIDFGEFGNEDSLWEQGFGSRILDLAWKQLQAYEHSNLGSLPFTLLKLRTAFPDDTSAQLSEKLSLALGRSFRPDQVRQQLSRARARFSQILVDEVADQMANPSKEKVEEELCSLGLLAYVRGALSDDPI
jgi:RNA polymerase sigma factor (sigma-70 family)